MRSRTTRPLLVALGVALAPLALVQACAPGQDVASNPSGGGGGSSAASTGDGSLFDADIGDGSLTEDAACGVIKKEGKSIPVTLYIMLDKSSSMVGTKWDAAVAGISAFVDDPEFSGLRIGLRFFPRDPDNVPACDQAAYKTPIVPFGPLPDNAEAIKAAMLAESPDGFSTPIYPALGGALWAGVELETVHPDENAAVLLVTDGLPQGPPGTCSGVQPEDPAVIAELAATAADPSSHPPVETYVVGLPGIDHAFANHVAAAGGTGAAILVSTANVEAEFAAAIAKVAGEALPCEYELPTEVGGEFSTDKVNVAYTPAGASESVTLPQDPSCSGEGWRYDDPENPKHILLCPASCSKVKQDLGGKIEILLGCKTVVTS